MEQPTKLAVPTIVRALADNHALTRVAQLDLQRALRRHAMVTVTEPTRIAEAWQVVELATDAVVSLQADRDLLLASLTAHELTWAHLSEDCAICRGDVRVVNDQERNPF